MYYLLVLRQTLRLCLTPALLAASLILTVTTGFSLIANARFSHVMNERNGVNFKPLDQYTYIGDNYPTYYPLDLQDVSMTPENTIHYQIFTEDAEREWASVFPAGGGFFRLGPEGRTFGLALFHQMHCLARIQRAMDTRQSSEHVHHCFNYLRQAILCDANPTIEPVIPIVEQRSVNAEIPRVCRDWTGVYDLVKNNFEAAAGTRGRDEQGRAMYI